MRNFIIIGLLVLSALGMAQKDGVIAFYNCENLFDTIHAVGHSDYEYLPTSQRHWNTPKYYTKLNNLSRVILGAGDWDGPSLIGLCEVENKKVVLDLANETYLRQYGYQVIHRESDDERGIDVACMYKASEFELLDSHYVKVEFPYVSRPTRDILYVRGVLKTGDTVNVYFNHWPSRYGGRLVSAKKRMAASEALQEDISKVRGQYGDSSLFVLMGDFNDGPEDVSIQTLADSAGLINTSLPLHQKGLGTHKYKEEWNLFDQVLVSEQLANSGTSFIYAPSWLQEIDEVSFGKKPYRTYYGTQYNGGFSDHFAVGFRFKK